MKNRISNKLYGALLRCGTPPEIAAIFAKNAEFLGESNDETVERDNYEIMVTAKALSSLIKRHANSESAQTPAVQPSNVKPTASLNEKTEDGNSSDTIVIDKEDDGETEKKQEKKKNVFWEKLESLPVWLRNTLAFLLPSLMYLFMILLTVLVVVLIAGCILGMIAMTIAGIILFIVGLLYGVSQINVFPAAAYYEIGLGLILGGASALLIVLLYNALTKLLPFSLKFGIKKLRKLTMAFSNFRAEMRDKAVS